MLHFLQLHKLFKVIIYFPFSQSQPLFGDYYSTHYVHSLQLKAPIQPYHLSVTLQTFGHLTIDLSDSYQKK